MGMFPLRVLSLGWLLLTLTASPGECQRIMVGGGAGASLSHSSATAQDARWGRLVFARAAVVPNGILSLELGLQYVEKGEDPAVPPAEPGDPTAVTKLRLAYLEVPLVAMARLPLTGRAQGLFGVGIATGFNTKATFDNGPDVGQEMDDPEMSLGLAGGFAVGFGSSQVELRAHHWWGLSDRTSPRSFLPPARNRNFTFSLGLAHAL